MPLKLLAESRTPCVLLLGAHCDDIEIGCGGLLLRLAANWPHAEYHWVTLSSDAQREPETRAAARRLLPGVDAIRFDIATHKQSYFPAVASALKDHFEDLKRRCTPDVILTHAREDLHQDHRLTNELTWNTFRNHLILEYEIPKYDGDLGRPNVFVPLTQRELAAKCDALMECFPSQRARSWFTRSTFEAMARLRGIECNAPEGFAEAFYARKACIGL
jgi:LmbE family N-acetylglucosaminyl deacetylase